MASGRARVASSCYDAPRAARAGVPEAVDVTGPSGGGCGVVAGVGPSFSAHWASITHFDKIGDQGGGELGYVTVARCERGSLIGDWSCSGTFQVNDPMADPYPPTPDVRVVNDFRWHRPGTTIGATIWPDSHVGYSWGTTVQLQALEYFAGALACLAVLVVSATVVARRRRSVAVAWLILATWIMLAGGFLLVGASASL